MPASPRLPVLLLPGGVTPVAHAYAELVAELGKDVRTVPKDHEIYAGPAPPAGWDCRLEADASAALVAALPGGRVHVVGFSLGADIILRLLVRHPARIASAALVEPEWIGDPAFTAEEDRLLEEARSLATTDPGASMDAFLRSLVAPGVPPPTLPGVASPPWMASRLAVLPLFLGSEPDPFDLGALRGYDRPVYLALGEGSAPRFARATRL
ncbi:MAG TPA: alpha/beta fold hydrolase, partial [Candidatus Thermoplasmatota archaeon]|nr:alpha/beta fold hydrolase [Candidatus Thermoplasmatota archaeon]